MLSLKLQTRHLRGLPRYYVQSAGRLTPATWQQITSSLSTVVLTFRPQRFEASSTFQGNVEQRVMLQCRAPRKIVGAGMPAAAAIVGVCQIHFPQGSFNRIKAATAWHSLRCQDRCLCNTYNMFAPLFASVCINLCSTQSNCCPPTTRKS